jgi:TRAP-type C4-dicarboxylate transport system substrate-binding protein
VSREAPNPDPCSPCRVRASLAAAFAFTTIAASAQDVQERVIKFGHLNNTDHPVSMGVKRFAELLAAKSGGKLKVQEFPASQLGNELQQQAALQGGVQEMSAPATTSLAGIVKATSPNSKANPVPMAFAELYGALEAKAVDGQENPFAVILSNKFYEVNKFVSATNHVYAANIVLVSKRFWDRLSPVEQRMMHEAANEARGYQRTQSRAAAQKAVAELQAKGMQYNEVAPAEQARMRTIAKPVTEKFAASYDPAIVKLYQSELARVSK